MEEFNKRYEADYEEFVEMITEIEAEELTNEQRAHAVQVGDMMNVEGHRGTVTAINHTLREGTPCTYCKINFMIEEDLQYTPYNNAWYGSSDTAFNYYIERNGKRL